VDIFSVSVKLSV